MSARNRDVAFFVLGLAFVAIGAAQQKPLIAVGVVFIVIGAARMSRSRRRS